MASLILLLDNKDSFVWNLVQALRGLGAEVRVARTGAIGIEANAAVRAIVISPGPGRPDENVVAAVRKWSGELPILGVCLGHQAIGAAFGATIRRGPPIHGRTSRVHHDGTGLFAGLPNPVVAARYHALYVDRETLPAELSILAHSDDGEIMALCHREHPTYGVQFHPESFRSQHGKEVLANFLDMVPASTA